VIVHPSRHAVKRSLAGARGTLVVVAALIVAVAPVHFGISSLAACIALVVPVAVMVGEIAGVMRRATSAVLARPRPAADRALSGRPSPLA
jgi:hypothetical protein